MGSKWTGASARGRKQVRGDPGRPTVLGQVEAQCAPSTSFLHKQSLFSGRSQEVGGVGDHRGTGPLSTRSAVMTKEGTESPVSSLDTRRWPVSSETSESKHRNALGLATASRGNSFPKFTSRLPLLMEKPWDLSSKLFCFGGKCKIFQTTFRKGRIQTFIFGTFFGDTFN